MRHERRKPRRVGRKVLRREGARAHSARNRTRLPVRLQPHGRAGGARAVRARRAGVLPERDARGNPRDLPRGGDLRTRRAHRDDISAADRRRLFLGRSASRAQVPRDERGDARSRRDVCALADGGRHRELQLDAPRGGIRRVGLSFGSDGHGVRARAPGLRTRRRMYKALSRLRHHWRLRTRR